MIAKKIIILTGVAAVITASGSSQLANAGIDAGGRPGSSTGSIHRFGSVYVNGVRFNTDNAVFIIDKRFGDESELDLGQVVSVFGSVDNDGVNGTALIVSYDDLVEGPISEIDVQANRMAVLGQTVIVNNDTSFATTSHANSIGDLHENDQIEVSGFVDADGNIVATYVGDADAGNGLAISGTINGIDAGGVGFTVNDLHVDYSGANLYDLPFGVPTVGLEVEISGTRINADGQLVADSVWATQQDIFPGKDAHGEVEGYITQRMTLTDFEVNGTPVRVTWSTEFENDWFFGLNLNRKVEVEGTFDADGVLVAEKIDFERGAELRQRGYVEAVFDDLVVVNGTAIRVTGETTYADDSVASKRKFNIGDLNVGDVVKIRGYQSGSEIVATRLQRDDEKDKDDKDDEDDEDHKDDKDDKDDEREDDD
jgi:uncharacterized protein DUF5666